MALQRYHKQREEELARDDVAVGHHHGSVEPDVQAGLQNLREEVLVVEERTL